MHLEHLWSHEVMVTDQRLDPVGENQHDLAE